MPHLRRTILGAAPALLMRPALAAPEPFPTRPIRMIAPFPPGGPLDVTGRPLALELGAILGQTVVFENRPGANGIIGTQQVASARPDGYTVLITTGSFVGNILFSPVALPYDPMRDLAPVTLVADGSGMVLLGRTGLAAQDLAGLAALARAKPGALSCAVSGAGNITQLAAVQFQRFTGAELLEVVLASGPAMNELIAGNIDISFASVSVAAPLVREGQLRAFGYTGRRRANRLPDVPLMKELGFPDWTLFGMTGMWTTGGTPPEHIEILQKAVAKALQAPDVQRVLAQGESEASGMPPAEFRTYLEHELEVQRSLGQPVRR